MANKKVSQLTSKPSVLVTDLFPIADPSTGQLYKTTISDLGTAIGSGVSSVNGLVGAVVLDTDDIQELVSPTNKWFTDTRARAALSASSPLTYSSGTGAFGIQVANGSQNGYLSSTDWTTFNNKLSTATAAATYVPYTGATGNVNLGNNDVTAGSFTGGTASFATSGAGAAVGINHSSGAGIALNISKSGSGEGIYVNKTSGTGNAVTIIGTLNATTIVKNGGTSSQYLMADGSVSTLTNPVTGTGTSGIVAKFNGTSSVTDSIIYDNGTRVSIGADVTTSNKFTAVASTTSSYAVVAQASGAANGFWATLSGSGEIFRGQTSGGSYFIINNGGNAFLNGNLNIGDFASTSYKLKVNGTSNFTGGFTGFEYNSAGAYPAYNTYFGAIGTNFSNANSELDIWNTVGGGFVFRKQTGASAQTALLTIASSGAATFSSSVTANGNAFLSSTNTSGGVGIGTSSIVTSYSGSNILQIGTRGFIQNVVGNQMMISNNAYLNPDGWRYATTANAQAIRFGAQAAGDISFHSAPSGTAGNAISNWDTNDIKMYIAPSGNVGIGTTSPDVKLQVRNDVNGNSLVAKFSNLDTNAGTGAYIGFNTGYDATARIGALREGAGNSSSLIFLPMKNETPTEAMRIRSEGNVGIGTTGSSTIRLIVCGSGNNNSAFSFVAGDVGGNTLFAVRNDGYIYAPYVYVNTTGSAANVVVTSGGDLIRSTSSIKYKKNVLDYSKGLSEIMQMRAVTYEGKSKSDEGKIFAGLIAEEIHDLGLTEFVQYAEDGTPDALAYSNMVSLLVKGIQELKAELDTLKNK